MTKKPAFPWGAHDSIVHAWSDPCGGPGWCNTQIMVLVRDGNKHVRIEYLQPSQQTRDMVTLYSTSAAAHSAMTGVVVDEVSTWKRGKE